jgi:hypothetical protein
MLTDEQIKSRLEGAVERTLSDIYTELGISRGDITPDQSPVWGLCLDRLTELFGKLIKQNTETMEVKDLRKYIGYRMLINGELFILDIRHDCGGEWAVWVSGNYIIDATPNYEYMPVPVALDDKDGCFTGRSENYTEPVKTFREYCIIVKLLGERLIKEIEKV